MRNERDHERIAQGVGSGELVHLLNLQRGPHQPFYSYEEDRGRPRRVAQWRNPANEEVIHMLGQDYGEEAVVVSVPFNPETGSTQDLPGHIGLYVTAAAFESFQQARQEQPPASSAAA